ncbi:MAG: methyltransferase domain-containing protein [Spirochaetaceae bacterium]|nr:methyltransferase domain-containing protein [Spirochaetaceae bacterium]
MGWRRVVTAVCLQVRLDSARLPEKALITIEDMTIIEHAMRALCEVHGDLFLLLTTEECLERLKPLAAKWGFKIFCGPKDDVLLRFVQAADAYNIGTIIRATGDNPLVSASIANEVLDEHFLLGVDYSNWTDAPLGTGVEIVEARVLKQALKETDNKYDHEHVTPWIYKNPGVFSLNIHQVPRKYLLKDKVSLDTPEDLKKIKEIYSCIYKKRPVLIEELVEYLKQDILLIPSTGEGNGTGHFKRMMSLSGRLEGNVFLYIDEAHRKRLEPLLHDFDKHQITSSLTGLERYKKIIVDTRSIDECLYNNSLKDNNCIAIDEGGPYRDKIPYLIDILPLPHKFSLPNIRSISFLELPSEQKAEKNGKILVTFGGEDPSGLTEKFCNLIMSRYKYLIPELHILLGPLYTGTEPDSRFTVLRNIPNLRDLLPFYCGLICSFGITAYEASSLEIPVFLINPSDYHEDLSRISGFFSAGNRWEMSDKIQAFIENPSTVEVVKLPKEEISLAEHINSLDLSVNSCPVCSGTPFTVISRYKYKTYVRCDQCRMIYMLNFSKNKVSYNKEYFFNQYENQYGKTYLDDFEQIAQLAQQRLDIITERKKKDLSLLDIGCAYGPFLKKSQENGLIPYGTDISSDAAAYVQNELGFPVSAVRFEDFAIPRSWHMEKFDVITMWYVIEHFTDLSVILKKVNTLLAPGGIFAFSTPSGSGVSAKKNLIDFLFQSPDDHYTIWEPANSQKILDLYGFKIFRKRITGHHPERFPSFLVKRKIGRFFLTMASRIKRLGDTFEIYAVKVSEL